MGGALAEAYSTLLEEIWNGHNSYITPHHFRSLVERNAPGLQHDSLKFLTFLLNGLHHDLNLIKQNPKLKMVQTDGRSDTVSYWYFI